MTLSEEGFAVLGLGSNLGDRLGFLRKGVGDLAAGGVEVESVSSVFETPPVGYLDQPPFLNLVLAGRTRRSPKGILELIREVEAAAGRERSFPDAPRTLDVDLLFLGERIVRLPGLRVPHPRWRNRSFVVRPLAEILPGLRDPETGCTVGEIAARWPLEPGKIRLVEGPEALRDPLKRGSP